MNIYVLPSNFVQEPVVRDGRDKFIAVFLSPIVTDELQNLRCLNCGWVVCQFSNKMIDAFVFGKAVPESKNAVDVMCSRCHLTYRII